MFNQYKDPEVTRKNALCKLVVVLALVGTISSLIVTARDQSKYSTFQDTCLKRFEDASNALVVADARIALEQGLECAKEIEKDGAYINLVKIREYLEKLDADRMLPSSIIEAIKRNLQSLNASTSKPYHSPLAMLAGSVVFLGFSLVVASFQVLEQKLH